MTDIAKQKQTAKPKKQKKSRTSWNQWYTPENIELVEGWARDGLSDEQIAKNMGISTTTLYEWKKRHPEFLEAFKKGKQVVNVELENALFKKAIGAKTTTTTYRVSKVDEGVLKARRLRYAERYLEEHPDASKKEASIAAVEHVETHEKIVWSIVENKLPPDVGALMFLMKNRMPEKYREKSYQELNHAQAEQAKAQAEKAKFQAEISKRQLEMLNHMEDQGNQQLEQILDKLAKGVTADDGSGSVDQETSNGAEELSNRPVEDTDSERGS
ncbi:hypothetical protein lacNasYZ03_11600 [Lactobacillus nasalidis]|uniref:Helix-turn-helix domain-containing protein n=1 Tax=Lactobacillus nasalidis TaxID=2797258 RepID=A0ABQ3W4L8_9LACO|nr:terminase [Lactobacillus nasalidis]GHV97884.1 hypothetical protein lacNasYZ01_10660 [Lactobacillus nasalidis]GHW00114.1 hypothetical protein lacNasYZ02_15430 [Lactobacillus nasalidis]GHW01473.1 hypothetical protein lacNasYZ03_11600 [Lactobacillus nasalidis]